jgi:hypothetical protein
MNILGDWKWNAALGVFVLFTAVVVLWPVTDPNPLADHAVAHSPSLNEPDDGLPSSGLPDPPPDDYDEMLQYTIQEGDTWDGIAHLFVVRLEDILRVNRQNDQDEPDPGRMIWIPPAY